MDLTIPKRFDLQKTGSAVYAPVSHGCPSMLFSVDRNVFRKTEEEKMKVYNFKRKLGKTKHHKFQTLTHVQL